MDRVGIDSNDYTSVEGIDFAPNPPVQRENPMQPVIDAGRQEAIEQLAREDPDKALKLVSQGELSLDTDPALDHQLDGHMVYGHMAKEPLDPDLNRRMPQNTMADIKAQMADPLKQELEEDQPEADLESAKRTFEQFINANLKTENESIMQSLEQLQANLQTMDGVKKEIDALNKYKLRSYAPQLKMLSSLGTGGLVALQYGSPIFVYAGAAMAALHLIDSFRKGEIGGNSHWNQNVEKETQKLEEMLKRAESIAAATIQQSTEGLQNLPEEEREIALQEQADAINGKIESILKSLFTEVGSTGEGLRVTRESQPKSSGPAISWLTGRPKNPQPTRK